MYAFAHKKYYIVVDIQWTSYSEMAAQLMAQWILFMLRCKHTHTHTHTIYLWNYILGQSQTESTNDIVEGAGMGQRECEKWVMRSNKRVIVALVFKTSYKFDVTLYYFCHINVMALAGAHRRSARVEPVFLFICEKSSFFELNVGNGLDNVLYVYEVCCCIWKHQMVSEH